jgi:hypothetical protein
MLPIVFTTVNEKEIEYLRLSYGILSTNTVNWQGYSDLLSFLPNWLVSKLRLLPGDKLPSKLSCLKYQLEQFLNGTAADIEDHFLALGVSQADLTYIRSNGSYHFVDITTSMSIDIAKHKTRELKTVVGSKGSIEIRNIPLEVRFSQGRGEVGYVDIFDKFNELLVRSNHTEANALTAVLNAKAMPAVKHMIRSLAATDTVDRVLPSQISVPLNVHSKTWKFPGYFSEIFDTFVDKVTYDMSQPQLEVPLGNTKISVYPDIDTIYREQDPLTIAGLLAASTNIEPLAVYEVKIGSTPSQWVKILEADERRSSKYFKLRGKESPARRDVSSAVVPTIYLMVSKERVGLPSGLNYPKFFSAVSSNHWSTYGYYHMNGISKSKMTSESVLTVEAIRVAQAKHDQVVSFLAGSNKTAKAEVMSHLGLITSKLGESPYTSVALTGIEPDINRYVKSNIMNYTSQLSSISRTITMTSPVQINPFMYRIAQTTDLYHLLFVSISKPIEKVTDIAYVAWTGDFDKHPSMETHIKAKTVSSRKLVWWHKLPFVTLLKACSLSQSNMTGIDEQRYYSFDDLCEYMSFHLDTRQQDSLLFGQTRPTFAAVMSFIPDKNGALLKLKGLRMKGAESILYYARLAASHVGLYLRKAGMFPKVSQTKGLSPEVVFPSMNKPPRNMNEYVDSLFESRVFNKYKDNTLSSEAIDWLGLIENEVAYQKAVSENPIVQLGCSREMLELVTLCVADKSLKPIIDDISAISSVWISDIEVYWPQSKYADGDSFSWSAASLYAIMITRSVGKRFSNMSDDYTSPLAQLLDTPISEFISGTGATLGTSGTAEFQSCRKPTAILEVVAMMRGLAINPKQFGIDITINTAEFMDRHTSALSLSTWIMLQRQSLYLVSRTVDKDQAEGWREFSPMNGVGIIACRATEKPMSSLLKMYYPTDKMNDKDVETTLVNKIKSISSTSNLYVAADCSRFGPKQIMPSLRAAIACLCMTGGRHDPEEQSFMYNLLSESTRLMGSKVTKMPSNLFSFFKELGGYSQVLAHNESSVYGKIAKLSLYDLQWNFLSPHFTQEWGMLQGTISMGSSVKSSMMHDVVSEIITEQYNLESFAMVTNDDSLLGAVGLPETENIRDFSTHVVSLLKYALPIAGQKLNRFKTIASTLLGEFHSMFADPSGLIIPSYKKCFATIDVGNGEDVINDMRSPSKIGVSLLRDGVSLEMATFTSYLIATLIANQYSQFKQISNKGPGLTILGQLPAINLIKEVVLPNHSDFKILSSVGKKSATVMAAQQFLLEEAEFVTYKAVGFRKVSRSKYRRARALIEVGWPKTELALPLFRPTTQVALNEALNNGVYQSAVEGTKDHYLTRLAKGLTSNTTSNVLLQEGSLPARIFGKTMISKVEMDAVTIDKLVEVSESLVQSTPALKSITQYYDLLYTAHRPLDQLPSPFSLKIARRDAEESVVVSKPVMVKSYLSHTRYPGFERMVDRYGSEQIQLAAQRQKSGHYSFDKLPSFTDEISTLITAGALVNRVTKGIGGKFVLPTGVIGSTLKTRELIESLYANIIPNVVVDTRPLRGVLAHVENNLPTPYESAPTVLLNLASSTILGTDVSDVRSLFDILRVSPRGYFWSASNIKVKVAKIHFTRMSYGEPDSYIVTARYPRDVLGKLADTMHVSSVAKSIARGRSTHVYLHTIITEAPRIDTRDIKMFADFNLVGKRLLPGEAYAASQTDIIEFPPLMSLFPFVKVDSEGAINLVSKHIAIPYERMPRSFIGEVQLALPDIGSFMSVIDVLSDGLIGQDSRRMEQLKQRQSINPLSFCESIAEEYMTIDAYHSMRSGSSPRFAIEHYSVGTLASATQYLRDAPTVAEPSNVFNYQTLSILDMDLDTEEDVLDTGEHDLTVLGLVGDLHDELLSSNFFSTQSTLDIVSSSILFADPNVM